MGFCDSNETLILCPNLARKLSLKLIMNLFSKERKGMSQKRPKNLKKIDFCYFKVQVSKLTQIENFQYFFLDQQVCRSQTPKKVCPNSLVRIGAKPNLYCKAIELVCSGSPKICVLVQEESPRQHSPNLPYSKRVGSPAAALLISWSS